MSLEGGELICLDADGETALNSIKTKQRKLTIGSYMSCDYVLVHQDIQGIHCEIQSDAYGHITIQNFSETHPVLLNDDKVGIKRLLLNGSKIQVLDKKFIWRYKNPLSTSQQDAKAELKTSSSNHSTPVKQIGIPEQPPTSCPDLRYHREMQNRLTVHNFGYRIDFDDEGNVPAKPANITESIAEENEEAPDLAIKNTPVKETAQLENSVATPGAQGFQSKVISSSESKNTSSTEKTKKRMSQFGHSEIVITSYSPRVTGVCQEKTFTDIRPHKTPKSVYSTPKGAKWTEDEGSLRFSTPATSVRRSRHSVCLIDLTTPTKLRPDSPCPKMLVSAKSKLYKSCTTTTTTTKTPNAVATPGSSDSTASTIGSAISVDSSSCIELSEDTSDSRNSSEIGGKLAGRKSIAKSQMKAVSTPLRTPQSLMKRVLLTSAKKQAKINCSTPLMKSVKKPITFTTPTSASKQSASAAAANSSKDSSKILPLHDEISAANEECDKDGAASTTSSSSTPLEDVVKENLDNMTDEHTTLQKETDAGANIEDQLNRTFDIDDQDEGNVGENDQEEDEVVIPLEDHEGFGEEVVLATDENTDASNEMNAGVPLNENTAREDDNDSTASKQDLLEQLNSIYRKISNDADHPAPDNSKVSEHEQISNNKEDLESVIDDEKENLISQDALETNKDTELNSDQNLKISTLDKIVLSPRRIDSVNSSLVNDNLSVLNTTKSPKHSLIHKTPSLIPDIMNIQLDNSRNPKEISLQETVSIIAHNKEGPIPSEDMGAIIELTDIIEASNEDHKAKTVLETETEASQSSSLGKEVPESDNNTKTSSDAINIPCSDVTEESPEKQAINAKNNTEIGNTCTKDTPQIDKSNQPQIAMESTPKSGIIKRRRSSSAMTLGTPTRRILTRRASLTSNTSCNFCDHNAATPRSVKKLRTSMQSLAEADDSFIPETPQVNSRSTVPMSIQEENDESSNPHNENTKKDDSNTMKDTENAHVESESKDQESTSSAMVKQHLKDDMDSVYRTPRAKNVMIPNVPPSATLDKDLNSVELLQTTEYDLNVSNQIPNLEDMFKTPVAARNFPDISVQSPFSAADVLSDLPESEVLEWADNLETTSKKKQTKQESSNSTITEEHEITYEEESLGGETCKDPLQPSAVKSDAALARSNNSEYILLDVSASSTVLDPLGSSVKISAGLNSNTSLKEQDELQTADEECAKPLPASEMSGILALDHSSDSIFSEPLVVSSDSDTEQLSKEEKKQSIIKTIEPKTPTFVGVRELMKTPKANKGNRTYYDGLTELLQTPKTHKNKPTNDESMQEIIKVDESFGETVTIEVEQNDSLINNTLTNKPKTIECNEDLNNTGDVIEEKFAEPIMESDEQNDDKDKNANSTVQTGSLETEGGFGEGVIDLNKTNDDEICEVNAINKNSTTAAPSASEEGFGECILIDNVNEMETANISSIKPNLSIIPVQSSEGSLAQNSATKEEEICDSADAKQPTEIDISIADASCAPSIDSKLQNNDDNNCPKTPRLAGIRQMLQTPKATIKTPLFSGVRDLLKTPAQSKENEDNLVGIGNLLKTPKPTTCSQASSTPILTGLREMLKSPDSLNYPSEGTPKLKGVRELLKTPKLSTASTPKLTGVRELLKTPKVSNVEQEFEGIDAMLQTPKLRTDNVTLKESQETPMVGNDDVAILPISTIEANTVLVEVVANDQKLKVDNPKTPRFSGVREMLRTPKVAIQTPHFSGIRNLLKTPRQNEEISDSLEGVDILMKTPKLTKSTNESNTPFSYDLQEMPKSPDLSNASPQRERFPTKTSDIIPTVESAEKPQIQDRKSEIIEEQLIINETESAEANESERDDFVKLANTRKRGSDIFETSTSSDIYNPVMEPCEIPETQDEVFEPSTDVTIKDKSEESKSENSDGNTILEENLQTNQIELIEKSSDNIQSTDVADEILLETRNEAETMPIDTNEFQEEMSASKTNESKEPISLQTSQINIETEDMEALEKSSETQNSEENASLKKQQAMVEELIGNKKSSVRESKIAVNPDIHEIIPDQVENRTDDFEPVQHYQVSDDKEENESHGMESGEHEIEAEHSKESEEKVQEQKTQDIAMALPTFNSLDSENVPEMSIEIIDSNSPNVEVIHEPKPIEDIAMALPTFNSLDSENVPETSIEVADSNSPNVEVIHEPKPIEEGPLNRNNPPILATIVEEQSPNLSASQETQPSEVLVQASPEGNAMSSRTFEHERTEEVPINDIQKESEKSKPIEESLTEEANVDVSLNQESLKDSNDSHPIEETAVISSRPLRSRKASVDEIPSADNQTSTELARPNSRSSRRRKASSDVEEEAAVRKPSQALETVKENVAAEPEDVTLSKLEVLSTKSKQSRKASEDNTKPLSLNNIAPADASEQTAENEKQKQPDSDGQEKPKTSEDIVVDLNLVQTQSENSEELQNATEVARPTSRSARQRKPSVDTAEEVKMVSKSRVLRTRKASVDDIKLMEAQHDDSEEAENVAEVVRPNSRSGRRRKASADTEAAVSTKKPLKIVEEEISVDIETNCDGQAKEFDQVSNDTESMAEARNDVTESKKEGKVVVPEQNTNEEKPNTGSRSKRLRKASSDSVKSTSSETQEDNRPNSRAGRRRKASADDTEQLIPSKKPLQTVEEENSTAQEYTDVDDEKLETKIKPETITKDDDTDAKQKEEQTEEPSKGKTSSTSRTKRTRKASEAIETNNTEYLKDDNHVPEVNPMSSKNEDTIGSNATSDENLAVRHVEMAKTQPHTTKRGRKASAQVDEHETLQHEEHETESEKPKEIVDAKTKQTRAVGRRGRKPTTEDASTVSVEKQATVSETEATDHETLQHEEHETESEKPKEIVDAKPKQTRAVGRRGRKPTTEDASTVSVEKQATTDHETLQHEEHEKESEEPKEIVDAKSKQTRAVGRRGRKPTTEDASTVSVEKQATTDHETLQHEEHETESEKSKEIVDAKPKQTRAVGRRGRKPTTEDASTVTVEKQATTDGKTLQHEEHETESEKPKEIVDAKPKQTRAVGRRGRKPTTEDASALTVEKPETITETEITEVVTKRHRKISESNQDVPEKHKPSARTARSKAQLKAHSDESIDIHTEEICEKEAVEVKQETKSPPKAASRRGGRVKNVNQKDDHENEDNQTESAKPFDAIENAAPGDHTDPTSGAEDGQMKDTNLVNTNRKRKIQDSKVATPVRDQPRRGVAVHNYDESSDTESKVVRTPASTTKSGRVRKFTTKVLEQLEVTEIQQSPSTTKSAKKPRRGAKIIDESGSDSLQPPNQDQQNLQNVTDAENASEEANDEQEHLSPTKSKRRGGRQPSAEKKSAVDTEQPSTSNRRGRGARTKLPMTEEETESEITTSTNTTKSKRVRAANKKSEENSVPQTHDDLVPDVEVPKDKDDDKKTVKAPRGGRKVKADVSEPLQETIETASPAPKKATTRARGGRRQAKTVDLEPTTDHDTDDENPKPTGGRGKKTPAKTSKSKKTNEDNNASNTSEQETTPVKVTKSRGKQTQKGTKGKNAISGEEETTATGSEAQQLLAEIPSNNLAIEIDDATTGAIAEPSTSRGYGKRKNVHFKDASIQETKASEDEEVVPRKQTRRGRK